jgi:hypothetical protein
MKVHYNKEEKKIVITEVPNILYMYDVPLESNVHCKPVKSGLEIHLDLLDSTTKQKLELQK